MIVRQFLQWVRQAPPGERAEATSALARAYLYSDLSSDDLAAAEGAIVMLLDDDLVDLAATGDTNVQMAIASRAPMPCALAAAILEVGTAEACLTLLENPAAEIAPFSLARAVDRFGHLAPIRENLLAREDLPTTMRQALLA